MTAGGGVPDPGGLVPPASDEAGAVRAEGHRDNCLVVVHFHYFCAENWITVENRGPETNGAGRNELVSLLPSGAARNAVDCALWDLESRLSGKALADTLWGEPLRPVVTALTVSLDAPERMGEAAAALADCKLIKVKVDAADPEACLRAVRKAATCR